MRQAQIENYQVNVGKIGADFRQELRRRPDGDRLVAGAFDGGAKAVAHERGVVSDDDRFGGDRSCGHLSRYRTFAGEATARI